MSNAKNPSKIEATVYVNNPKRRNLPFNFASGESLLKISLKSIIKPNYTKVKERTK